MPGERLTFVGEAMATIVQGIAEVRSVIGQPPVVVGGLAVLCRPSGPYRAKTDLDVVDRLTEVTDPPVVTVGDFRPSTLPHMAADGPAGGPRGAPRWNHDDPRPSVPRRPLLGWQPPPSAGRVTNSIVVEANWVLMKRLWA